MNAVERRMDTYLRRQYDISLEERNAILKEQDNKCACCGREFDSETRMEVDHKHVKIETLRISNPKGWLGTVVGRTESQWGRTNEEAIKNAKRAALRGSMRGILCGGRYAGCNRKIGRIDNIEWMEKVVAYLKDPPARRVLVVR